MLKKMMRSSLMLLSLIVLAGCSMSASEKTSLERSLKQNVDGFVSGSVQNHLDNVLELTDGSFSSPDSLKDHLTKSWPERSTVTGGEIASMSWVGEGTAKVKVNWAFQTGNVMSYTSETFVWILKGGSWKYQGRALR